MHRLWAPWRLEYVETGGKAEPQGCFLCEFPVAGRDVEHGILWRWAHWYALLNAYPYTNGHTMLVLHRHHDGFVGLESAEAAELAPALGHCEAAVRQAYGPHGLNFGVNLGRVAGAGAVGHLHIHLVPRWNGDTNFMTAVAETRVLPESLESSYARLHAAFERCRPA
jgi:ATP adenylyltransferase